MRLGVAGGGGHRQPPDRIAGALCRPQQPSLEAGESGLEATGSTSEIPLADGFVYTQRLLGLSMEDPTPPLDTPEVVGVLKTRLFEGPK